jgi:hypothetical protein
MGVSDRGYVYGSDGIRPFLSYRVKKHSKVKNISTPEFELSGNLSLQEHSPVDRIFGIQSESGFTIDPDICKLYVCI